jgi:hypothetical protein
MPKTYKVLKFTLRGTSLPLAQYRHDGDFAEGDTRTIQYEGIEPIEQTFLGSIEEGGGWCDLD